MDPENRVLVFTPTGRDSSLIASMLAQAGTECFACASWDSLIEEIGRGVAAILLSEEVLEPQRASQMRALLDDQPSWSDIPVMMLIAHSADASAMHKAARSIGNVTLLERPMRVAALMSAVEYALRARRRQYQGRHQLQALERATRDLRANEQQLRDAHARKDEFLATLAHELRNPLAPIRNAMHVLRRKTPEPGLAPLHDIIERQLRQMVRLVDDLLEVSRITRGKVALQIERLDVASVLRGAIETSRPLIDAGRHTLVVELPPTPAHVDADAVRLGQVFANLLNNAAKYTDEGGRIVLSARVRDDRIEVSVTDNGIGIAPDMIASVFDIFTQVRNANTRAQGGLGIGLTLVRSLVELHGGSVEADSAGPGRGSRFTVVLPMAHSVAAVSDGDANTPWLTVPASRRVIVVDDNRDAADTLAMALRQHGADVQTTYCATDALGILAPHSNDIVIADLGMPDVDGFELARRVRADPSNAGVQLIALSGWGQAEDRTRAQAAGFDAHFTKPADMDALLALLLDGDRA